MSIDHPLAPDLLDRIQSLERQVRDLERSTTNARQGQIYLDAAGLVRVRIGPQPDGKHGVRVFTAAGATYFDQTTL